MNKCGWVRNGGECILQQENQELKSELETYNKGCSELRKIIEHKDEKINELKKHLEIPEHCNLKTLEDYKSYYEDTTKEKIIEDTYIDYCAYVNLAHRYSELKKQLEEKTKIGISDHKYASKCEDKVITMENQQKEFIEYMENEINKIKEEIRTFDIWHEVGVDINFLVLKKQLFMEDLQKYKEIIGGKDD